MSQQIPGKVQLYKTTEMIPDIPGMAQNPTDFLIVLKEVWKN